MRFVGGLRVEEAADALGVSALTVKWKWPGAWLSTHSAIKPERWQQLDKLFHSALQREPCERAAFPDEACAGDDALRKQIEVLLAAHEEAGSIEKPNFEVEHGPWRMSKMS